MEPSNRGNLWRRAAVLSVALAVIVFVSITAMGFVSGILFAVSLGTGTALAVFSDTKRRSCTPRFLRRRG
jgi:hypothetical protein